MAKMDNLTLALLSIRGSAFTQTGHFGEKVGNKQNGLEVKVMVIGTGEWLVGTPPQEQKRLIIII